MSNASIHLDSLEVLRQKCEKMPTARLLKFFKKRRDYRADYVRSYDGEPDKWSLESEAKCNMIREILKEREHVTTK